MLHIVLGLLVEFATLLLQYFFFIPVVNQALEFCISFVLFFRKTSIKFPKESI
jgi:hypothetical protein